MGVGIFALAMNRLTDMEFDEISLVTRPANQLSKVVLFKSDEQEPVVSEEVVKGKKKMMPPQDTEDSMDEADMMDEEEMQKGKKKPPMKKDDAEDTIDLPNEVFEYISALEAANAELLEQVEKMASPEEEDEDIMKSADPAIVAIVKAAEERAEAAERIAKAERDFRLEREFIAKAATLTHIPVDSGAFGALLKSVADAITTEQFNGLWEALASANSALAESGLFSEVGKSGAFDNDSVFSPIDKAAQKILAVEPNLTKEQAIAKAVSSDPNLYISYLRGN